MVMCSTMMKEHQTSLTIYAQHKNIVRKSCIYTKIFHLELYYQWNILDMKWNCDRITLLILYLVFINTEILPGHLWTHFIGIFKACMCSIFSKMTYLVMSSQMFINYCDIWHHGSTNLKITRSKFLVKNHVHLRSVIAGTITYNIYH